MQAQELSEQQLQAIDKIIQQQYDLGYQAGIYAAIDLLEGLNNRYSDQHNYYGFAIKLIKEK